MEGPDNPKSLIEVLAGLNPLAVSLPFGALLMLMATLGSFQFGAGGGEIVGDPKLRYTMMAVGIILIAVGVIGGLSPRQTAAQQANPEAEASAARAGAGGNPLVWIFAKKASWLSCGLFAGALLAPVLQPSADPNLLWREFTFDAGKLQYNVEISQVALAALSPADHFFFVVTNDTKNPQIRHTPDDSMVVSPVFKLGVNSEFRTTINCTALDGAFGLNDKLQVAVVSTDQYTEQPTPAQVRRLIQKDTSPIIGHVWEYVGLRSLQDKEIDLLSQEIAQDDWERLVAKREAVVAQREAVNSRRK